MTPAPCPALPGAPQVLVVCFLCDWTTHAPSHERALAASIDHHHEHEHEGDGG